MAGAELNIVCQGLSQLSIGESDGHSAAWPSDQETDVEIVVECIDNTAEYRTPMFRITDLLTILHLLLNRPCTILYIPFIFNDRFQWFVFAYILLYSLYLQYDSPLVPSDSGLASTMSKLPACDPASLAHKCNQLKWLKIYNQNGMNLRRICQFLLQQPFGQNSSRHHWLPANPLPK